LDELESLKPEFKRRLDKLNESHIQAPLPEENGFNMALQSPANTSLEWPAVNKRYNSSMDFKQVITVSYIFTSIVGMLKILKIFSSVLMVPELEGIENFKTSLGSNGTWTWRDRKFSSVLMVPELELVDCTRFWLFCSYVLAYGLYLLPISTLILFSDIFAVCWIGLTIFTETQ